MTVLRTCNTRLVLLAFQLLANKGFQDPRDSTIALIVLAAVSGHLHVVRVYAFHSLYRSFEISFR